jgi:hypothetical protein
MRSAFRAFVVGLAVALLPLSAQADIVDTEIGSGISTAVAHVFGVGSNVAIRTSVTSVNYAPPVRVERDRRVYLETRGSIQGTGWGGAFDTLGGPGPSFDAEAHYTYDVPFVLRWPESFRGTLVYYAHGRPNLGFGVYAEGALGEANELRWLGEAESALVSDVVLEASRGHALFAPTLGGLRRDGGFAATATEGPFAGQPLNLTTDAPLTRDLALVARRLLERLSGRPVEHTIGVGHSGGAFVMQYVAGGVTTPFLDGPHFGRRVFTGGNFVRPYDPSSGLVFDGIIPIAGAAPLVHLAFPATARVIQLAGDADYAGVDMVIYVSRLLRAGVDVNAYARVFQISNLPHNFAEVMESTPNVTRLLATFGIESHPDSERMAPVLAAAIDRMQEWIARGTPPPPSRVNGRGIDTNADGVEDAIEFAQAAGAITRAVPFVEDPSIDTILSERFEMSAAAGQGGLVGRYAEVLGVLHHVPGSLKLPYNTCRLGGYELFAEARLVPFPDLAERWPNRGSYGACITKAMNRLAAEGLYDRHLGGREVWTESNLQLLGQ